jgi:hypothetical protein
VSVLFPFRVASAMSLGSRSQVQRPLKSESL